MKDLKIGGEKPAGGTLLINDNGEQALAIYDKDQKWCAVKTYAEEKIRIIDHYKKCDKDIAENLIINGYGEYGDNTNFSKFTYEDGAFSTHTTTSKKFISDQSIPIDPDAIYSISAEMKSNDNTTRHYAGLSEFDIDQNAIASRWINYVENTLTELTQDLKKGDTTVHLNNIGSWIQSPWNSNFPDINKGFIFWDYKDSTGYLYPPETYSQTQYSPVFEYSNIHKDTNTIALSSPWSGKNIPSGTKVSQSHSAAMYNYSLTAEKFLSSTYQKYQNQISGYGGNDTIFTKFRYGTHTVKFLCLPNYSSHGDVTTHYKNIVLKKVN